MARQRDAVASLLALAVVACLPAATDTVSIWHDLSGGPCRVVLPVFLSMPDLVCAQAFGLSGIGQLFGSSKSFRSETPEVTLDEIRRLRCVPVIQAACECARVQIASLAR